MEMILTLVAYLVIILSMIVILMGFMYFEEWEAGIELMPIGYNNFELGISNRNHILEDDGKEQELRIGFLLFTLFITFRRFDA